MDRRHKQKGAEMFKKIWSWFKVKVIPALVDFFGVAFTDAKQEVRAAIKDIAIQAVLEASGTALSNEEKRKRAFDRIKAYSVARGIIVRDHVIDLAISLAVSALKG
jgi:hypothetical protein